MAKRRNHRGSVYKRKDGRWVAAYQAADGRRRVLYRRSADEAERALTEAKAKQDKGLVPRDGTAKLGPFLDLWLRFKQPRVKRSTHKRYSSIVASKLTPLRDVAIGRLNHRDIEELYAQLLEDGVNPGTVRLVHKVLRAALGQAEKWQNIPSNPARLASPPASTPAEITVLTEEQSRLFLAACEGEPLQAAFVLALTSGMRQGEILALGWDDIDFDAKTVSVRRSLRWIDGEPVFSEPKTKRSRRTIPVDQQTIDALKAHRARQAEQRLRIGDAWANPSLVFASSVGTPIRAPHLLERHFWPILRTAGLIRTDERGEVVSGNDGKAKPLVRFHDLRHTHATQLLKRGVSSLVVSRRLGHAREGFTLEVYGHLIPGMQETAVDAISQALWA